MEKRLYKKSSSKMIAGVCAGVAEYFNVDVTLVRVGFALFVLFAGTGVALYIICAIIMPDEETVRMQYEQYQQQYGDQPWQQQPYGQPPYHQQPPYG